MTLKLFVYDFLSYAYLNCIYGSVFFNKFYMSMSMGLARYSPCLPSALRTARLSHTAPLGRPTRPTARPNYCHTHSDLHVTTDTVLNYTSYEQMDILHGARPPHVVGVRRPPRPRRQLGLHLLGADGPHYDSPCLHHRNAHSGPALQVIDDL